MITKPRTDAEDLFGLPAAPEALERYDRLGPVEQKTLARLIKAVATEAQALGIPLAVEWWTDEEDEAWQEFVLAANPAGEAAERLDALYRLSGPLEREASRLEPAQRAWRIANLGMVLAPR